MTITVALIGNQNSGKTTLFNALTGSHQHIGNFPGITVDKKEGECLANQDIHIIDLPGIYSISSYSVEEFIAISYILEKKPDVIINVVDATNLERNLYLTQQLLELEIPVVVALNRIDVVTKRKQIIDVGVLEDHLQIPIIPISAQKKRGLDSLIQAVGIASTKPTVNNTKIYGDYEKYMVEAMHICKEACQKHHIPLQYGMIRLLIQKEDMVDRISLSAKQMLHLTAIRKVIEQKYDSDIESIIITMRYDKISEICREANYQHDVVSQKITDAVDHWLMDKYLGTISFLVIIYSIFYLSFHILGNPLQHLLVGIIQKISQQWTNFLTMHHVAPWLISLWQKGIFAGIGSVLSFLPIIILLFFFLSLLEDSGYMARIAYLMDGLLQHIGLSGKALIPLLLGYGCSVPAVLSTRTLSSTREKKITMLLIPFMPCSAKLPIYTILIQSFFSHRAALAMFFVYGIGILIATLVSFLLRNNHRMGMDLPFIMELPTYRLPTIPTICRHVLAKSKDFMSKTFTIIFISSIVIWLLQSMTVQWHYTTVASQSILAAIGRSLSFLLLPLGCADWRLTTSLFTGIIAKESIVSSLAITMQASHEGALITSLHSLLHPTSALAFLTFTLLYTPCIATIATLYKELHTWKATLSIILLQTCIAYITAMIIYMLGNILTSL